MARCCWAAGDWCEENCVDVCCDGTWGGSWLSEDVKVHDKAGGCDKDEQDDCWDELDSWHDTGLDNVEADGGEGTGSFVWETDKRPCCCVNRCVLRLGLVFLNKVAYFSFSEAAYFATSERNDANTSFWNKIWWYKPTWYIRWTKNPWASSMSSTPWK